MARSPYDHRDLEAETNKKQEIHVLPLLFTLGLGNMSRMEGKTSTLFSSTSISHSIFSTRMKWSNRNSPATILPIRSGFSPLESFYPYLPNVFTFGAGENSTLRDAFLWIHHFSYKMGLFHCTLS